MVVLPRHRNRPQLGRVSRGALKSPEIGTLWRLAKYYDMIPAHIRNGADREYN